MKNLRPFEEFSGFQADQAHSYGVADQAGGVVHVERFHDLRAMDVTVSGAGCYNHAMSLRSSGSMAVLERLLERVTGSLNTEAARQLVKLKADAKTQARIDKLARKCNEGELTPPERSEYERYVTVGNLIAILRAKARLILAQKT